MCGSVAFNHGVLGSSPSRLTSEIKDLVEFSVEAASKKIGLEAPWKQHLGCQIPPPSLPASMRLRAAVTVLAVTLVCDSRTSSANGACGRHDSAGIRPH